VWEEKDDSKTEYAADGEPFVYKLYDFPAIEKPPELEPEPEEI